MPTYPEPGIVRYTASEVADMPSRTDWRALDAMTDEEIEAAIDGDPDAAPRLDAEWFKDAVVCDGIPLRKDV